MGRRATTAGPLARAQAQPRQGQQWYRIDNQAAAGTAVIYVYDEIGYWGVTAGQFVEELSELNVSAIDVHINSPGGEVFEGLAIMNCLRAHPATVTTYVDGIAASIASVIAMAGDRIIMGPHSQLMIHEGSGCCIGDAAEMRKMADVLDFQSNNIAGVYAARAGGDVAEWRARMTAETWFTAEEAVAAGLADEVAQTATTTDAAMSNSWDLSVFRHAGRAAAPDPATVVNTAPAAKPEPAVGGTFTLKLDITGADATLIELLRANLRLGEEGAAEDGGPAEPPPAPATETAVPAPAPEAEPAAPQQPPPAEDGEDEPVTAAEHADLAPAAEPPATTGPPGHIATPEPAPAAAAPPQPEPEHDRPDDWAATVAHLTTPAAPPDWTALTAHLTQPASSRAATAA